MSHDLILGNSPRTWSRVAPPAATVATRPVAHKIALGGMALGSLLGLALITSPWWSDRRKPYHHTDWTGKKLPAHRRP
jgi:hypothetical protein